MEEKEVITVFKTLLGKNVKFIDGDEPFYKIAPYPTFIIYYGGINFYCTYGAYFPGLMDDILGFIIINVFAIDVNFTSFSLLDDECQIINLTKKLIDKFPKNINKKIKGKKMNCTLQIRSSFGISYCSKGFLLNKNDKD